MKCFVAGIAAAGLLWLLDPLPLYYDEKSNNALPEFPLSIGLMTQIQRGLLEVAPELIRPLLTPKLHDALERAPTDWWIARWEILHRDYDIPIFLRDQVFVHSLSSGAQKKVIDIFLHFCPNGGLDPEGIMRGMDKCFPVFFSGYIINTLTLVEQEEVFKAVISHDVKDWVGNHPWFGQEFITLFSLVISHEYKQLLDSDFLLKAIETARYDKKDRRFFFYTQTTYDYLRNLLRAIFSIWNRHKNAYLGNLPYEICLHLLFREDLTDVNREILEELNRVAPSKWYQDYIVRLGQEFPVLEEILGKRFEEEQVKAMEEETPEGDDEEDLARAMAYNKPKWDDD